MDRLITAVPDLQQFREDATLGDLAKASPAPSLLKTMTCIEDLRQAARRRVPRAFFDYVEAGSYSEQTLRANSADLERLTFRLDGFASVNAPYAGGEMTTPPFTFDGRRLVLNCATSAAGGIRCGSTSTSSGWWRASGVSLLNQ